MLDKVIEKWGGKEVQPMVVYRDIFQLGDGLIQRSGEQEDFKTNPIGYWKNKGDRKGHYRILLEDTFEDTIKEMQEADFSIINGLTYFGRKNLMEHASKMYAMIFDLDGVTDSTLANFFSGSFRAKAYPVPNYIVLSGHGVHLYYIFEEPVPLYPNIKFQLKELKYALTLKMWNMYTSTEKKIQFQGINQGFRVIGGKTKIKGVRTRAFEINTHPYTLDALCQFVPPEKRIDESKLYKESRMSLEAAKKKYPDWYNRIIINKEPKGTWECKRALYDWWIRKIQEGAAVGHRYFCIMVLAIYGAKCGLEFEEVKKDALELVPFLNELNSDLPFSENDALSALECFDQKYKTFPRADIEKISGIRIDPNKRNGRKQKVHVQIMNSTRDILYPDGEWRNKNGRPKGSGTKEDEVKKIVAQNPEMSVSALAKKIGCSRNTIYKYKS